jgi:hypothetical protein
MLSMSDELSKIASILKGLGPSIQVLLCRAQISLEEYKRKLGLESRRAHPVDEPPASLDDLSYLLSQVDPGNRRSDTGFMGVFRSDALGVDDWDPLADWGNGWQWEPTGLNGNHTWNV